MENKNYHYLQMRVTDPYTGKTYIRKAKTKEELDRKVALLK